MVGVINEIENLLVLQERDKALFEIETKILQAPKAKAEILSRKAQAQADFKESEDAVKALESLRLKMRSNRLSNEEKISKLKIQLSLVKKNDEYQALIKAIENANVENSKNEESELELLFKIDEAKANFEIVKTNHAQTLKSFEAELKNFDESLAALENSLSPARLNVHDAELKCAKNFLEAYQFVRKSKKTFPAVTPVIDGKCSGCHLKISGAIDAELKSSAEPVFCENCGRVIFFE